jgi:dTDP-4-dehydrorhamnose 3,5-epimerase
VSQVFKSVKELEIPGVWELIPWQRLDERGSFVKTMHSGEFDRFDLACDFKEEFFSVSKKNVLRGIHFQNPPADHEKLVYCIAGGIIDVIVDLRISSLTYGKYIMVNVNPVQSNIIYIPKGCGHGFLSLEDNSIVIYKTTTVHSPEHDTGIHWNSIGIPWPIKDPIVSERDNTHISLSDFVSPFK